MNFKAGDLIVPIEGSLIKEHLDRIKLYGPFLVEHNKHGLGYGLAVNFINPRYPGQWDSYSGSALTSKYWKLAIPDMKLMPVKGKLP